MSNTSESKLNVEWEKINWKKVQRKVFKLQKRIYRASVGGDRKQLRKLQKTLIRSWSAKLLATRTVTQDNSGKKTAGVDGIKSVTPKNRLKMARELNLKTKPLPARRIYIPKPGKTEKRPLSIPAMQDRATQALIKLALEPEWEARFEPNSYGFRPGRSCHDAIEAIFNGVNKKEKYVLDADISKCFDKIDHNYLLRKLETFPSLTRLIKSWLKAGWMFQGKREESTEGTPQGGVISPLLANVALHGMEERLNSFTNTLKGRKRDNRQNLNFIRYADDFIIMHPSQEVILQTKEIIMEWLKEVGLELSEAKTCISHTSEGFNFLGFNIRQYPAGKYSSGKSSNGKLLGFKTLIKPSTEKVKEHYRKIAETINKMKTATQGNLIIKLNPIIKGWANYNSTVVSKETFSKLDNLIWKRIWRWCNRRHPGKSASWVKDKYFHPLENSNWVFKEGPSPKYLNKHSETEIKRHVKVKGTASPFEGNEAYWAARLGKHPELPTRVSKLLKAQKGRCNVCGLLFQDGDRMEIDHIKPRSLGGKDVYDNLQLLHRHCHDTKTAKDGSLTAEAGCTNENGHIGEEPDEAKVSRPVRKTSGNREVIA